MTVRTFRIVIAIAALALISPVAAAQSPAPETAELSNALDAVKALEHRLETALTGADASVLGSVVANDFVFNSADGVTFRRLDWIKEFAQPGRFVSRTLTSLHVEPHDDAVLTKGRLEVTTSAPSQYTVCYIRLYARRGGRWKLISHHTFRELMGSFAETCAPK